MTKRKKGILLCVIGVLGLALMIPYVDLVVIFLGQIMFHAFGNMIRLSLPEGGVVVTLAIVILFCWWALLSAVAEMPAVSKAS